jgi:hypothetical protein
MNQKDNKKLFALIRNSLIDLAPKERNELAQMCIDMNKTTSIECYSEALRIPKRTLQNRISLNKVTTLQIHGKKFPSIGIIE